MQYSCTYYFIKKKYFYIEKKGIVGENTSLYFFLESDRADSVWSSETGIGTLCQLVK